MRTHDFQIETHEHGDSVTITTSAGIVLEEEKKSPPKSKTKEIVIGTGPIITGRPMMAAAKWIASRFENCLDDEIILWRGKTKCLSNSIRNILYPPKKRDEVDDAGA